MTKRMVTSAVFAGFAAGLIAVLLHFAFVQKLILLSEQYESGTLTHFAGGAPAHDYEDAPAQAQDASEAGHSHDEDGHGAGHSHGTSTASDLQRDGLTALFMVLIYTGYALVLTAGFAFAEMKGRKIGPAEGMLWGIAGFAAFQWAPAMGIAPALPGTVAADITARQIWWWSTVLATGGGIALLAYGRQVWAFALAGALLAAPHVVGAPEVEGYFGMAPPEVAAAFATRVLGAALVVWAALGWIAGHFWASSGREI
jgi:cobalt transporter subunit CbtA